MKQNQELVSLERSCSYSSYSYRLSKVNLDRSASLLPNPDNEFLVPKHSSSSPSSSPRFSDIRRFHNVNSRFSSLLRSLLKMIVFPHAIIPFSCKWQTLPFPTHLPSLGRKVTGTLFGNRRGHVSFAVQDDPQAEPVLLLELSMSTSSLIKEMSSGLVRIALECKKVNPGRTGRLFHEPMWTMYCNGRKSGYAVSRACTESDWHVLSTVRSVSVGAGVIPVVEDARKGSGAGGSDSKGELLYMRARFERVVGSRDSEAFYMMNPDNNGGPELSIFFLRI